MQMQQTVRLFDIGVLLSEVLDFISSELVDHHKIVAYIADCLAGELGMPEEARKRAMLAGLAHDIGALSLRERMDSLKFELENPNRHAELGAMFLELADPFSDAARVVRHHHEPWNHGDCTPDTPEEAHIVHLADRVSVLIDPRREILGQVDGIRAKIRRYAGALFAPHIVGAFEFLAARESFWFSLTRPLLGASLKRRGRLMGEVSMDIDALGGLARLFCRLIDFRSRFTSTHSSGVAAVASLLSHYTGMSDDDARLMEVAGYFHDIGKLAVPLEIIEKPAALNKDEFNIVKSHAFYTYYLLDRIPMLHTVRDWAALHHERLNGKGYPFHYTFEKIPLGARVMAVADVFTAMTEDRPFRKAMRLTEAMWTIGNMADSMTLDGDIVRVLASHMDEINDVRGTAQREALESYASFGMDMKRAV